MRRFKDSRDRGGSYLLKIVPPDGEFGDLAITSDHKLLTAFEVCGHSNMANRLCDYIRKKGMTPRGDFGPRPKNFKEFRYTYPNSWAIIGAHRLENFDISQKGMDFLMDFWDSESGGFYSSPTKRDSDTEQDIIYVSFCGLAALYTCRIEIARAVGVWMRTVMKAQPDFPNKLYTVYSRAKGLHILPDNELRSVVYGKATSYQRFFQPGAAAAFLSRLFLATGELEWLALAKEYLLFAEEANDYLFRLPAAGKVGWASSLLYSITGEKKYKQMAILIGDNIIASESRKQRWGWLRTNKPSIGLTAEMVIWLDAIHQAVGDE